LCSQGAADANVLLTLGNLERSQRCATVSGFAPEHADNTALDAVAREFVAPHGRKFVDILLRGLSMDAIHRRDLLAALAANSGAALTGPAAAAATASSTGTQLQSSFEDFGAKGDGAVDDYSAIARALASGGRIVSLPRKTYRISRPLVIKDRQIDFNGATLLYAGPAGQFAMSVIAEGTFLDCEVKGFVLKTDVSDTATSDLPTHGVCLGGSNGKISDFKVEGFTGISVALGSGQEKFTGVVLPSPLQCYYWDVSNFNVTSASGWNLVVKASNNANRFSNISTFPSGRRLGAGKMFNCKSQIVVGGTANTFERVSLEASSAEEAVVFLSSANANEFLGKTYFEYNPKFGVPPFPRVVAQVGSSSNRLVLRHPYGSQSVFNDLGVANEFRADPSYFVNGGQTNSPEGSANLVRNGDFENGTSYWSNLSTNGRLTTSEPGYLFGKSLRVDVVNGRPNVRQDLVGDGGFNLRGLVGQNITVSGFVRTNLPGLRIQVAGLTQSSVDADEVWKYFTSTVKLPPESTGAFVQLITSGSGLTGYCEASNVTAVIGCRPLVIGTRQPLDGSAPYELPSIATGHEVSATVTVPGAALGDFVFVSFSADVHGLKLNAHVSAPGLVAVVLRNDTGGPVSLPRGTLRARVLKV
jgi:hypothetical protein